MTTNSVTHTESKSARKPGGPLPWILLAVWFAWLLALVAMSIPEWGKSKRDLIETKEQSERQFKINRAPGN